MKEHVALIEGNQLQSNFGAVEKAEFWPSLLLMLYLLCVVFPVGFKLGSLHITSLRLLLLLVVIPLFIRLLFGHLRKVFLIDFLFLAHVLWLFLALFLTSPDHAITQFGSVGVEFIGGYLVGRVCVRNEIDFIFVCRFLIGLALFLFPFAVIDSLTGRSFLIEAIGKIPGVETVSKVRPDPRMGLFRAQVSFAHAIHFGLFCSVVFSLCFVALQNIYSTSKRFVVSSIIVVSGFLSLSSGALLAILLQVGLILWEIVFRRFRWRWWLLFGVLVFAYIFVDLVSNRSPLKVFMSYATFSAHNAYWRGIIFEWGIKNIFGDPILGIPASPWVGIGLSDWVRPAYMNSGSMDNFWLVVGVRYGIPGFLFLAIGYLCGIFKISLRNFECDVLLNQLRRAWVFTFVGLTFTLCTVHVWSNIFSFVFFFYGAGVWMMSRVKNETVPEDYVITSAQQPSFSRFAQKHIRDNNVRFTGNENARRT